jgi:hypothetical protein
MTEQLVILGARGGGGSGKGISYYQKLLGCIRRGTLSSEDDEYEDTDDSAVGKAGHALLEFYHRDGGGVALPFQTTSADPALVEAVRLFAAYRERFSPTALGEVLGCELPFEAAYEGIPVTARMDMVVRLGLDDIAAIKDSRGVDLSDLGPGVYIVDHKFKKAHNSDMVLNFQTSPQSAHYQNMWNLAHPDDKTRGMLFNVIFRYKTVSEKMFKLVTAPPPDASDIAFVEGIVRDGSRELKTKGPMWANPVHCFDFHRTCPHFFYCDRTNK